MNGPWALPLLLPPLLLLLLLVEVLSVVVVGLGLLGLHCQYHWS
jgi:hypothetical protein